MQNEETGKIEQLTELKTPEDLAKLNMRLQQKVGGFYPNLIKLDGSPVSKTAIVFTIDELVDIKGYTYRLVYMNESTLVFTPVSPEDSVKFLKKAGDGKEE